MSSSCGSIDIQTITLPDIFIDSRDEYAGEGFTVRELIDAFSLSDRHIRRLLKNNDIPTYNGKYLLDLKTANDIFLKIPTGYSIKEISELYAVPETSVRRRILGKYEHKTLGQTKYYKISPSELREIFLNKES